ncbi:MAG: xanthine dehydrogenase family protein molybdopterin-binding subunit [Defluviicoccus sp.]|nr:xanthine dehydrogenase family protein molybdopterin-binding subunit [Defluviicoccus sp.]MDE0385326.1 xanthine dehydrogenase family protein molybdopterin-binding subunit [Defluviicoccus sp.]
MAEAAVEAGGIGQPVLRKEDLRLLRGRGRYTDDIALAGQAHAAMLRSPHAHARIAGIDTAAARAMPGAIDVLTAADLAGDAVGTIPSYSQIAGLVDLVLENADGSPRRGTPLPVLAGERVRFVGDIVAVAIGETRAAAADAAERIAVDYEPLGAVAEAPAALAPGAPILWDDIPGNTCIDGYFGDPEATERAFAAAAHAVELKTRVQRVTGVMMEPRAAVAVYDADAERYTLYCGGDNPVRVKRDLAAVFGVEEGRVRVVAGDVGGNYGTRNWTYPEYAIALWAARRLGRPVKWTASRSESFLSDYQGRDLAIDAALALDAEGNFLALRSSLISNVGGYTVSFVPITKTSELAPTVYRFPAAHVRARAAMSNTPSTAPYRSAGRPEAMLAMERLVDLAARAHGFDPVALRRRNLVPRSAMPYRTALGLTYDSGDYEEAMDRALRLADWDGFPARRAEARARGRLRGIGLANSIEITSGFPVERAGIAVRSPNLVEVVIGTLSSGQGHETAFAQCVADWLGVPFDSIRLVTGDTDIVPEGGGSHSARSMRMAGIVMGRASELVIEKAKTIAADMLEAAVEDVAFDAGRFAILGTDRGVTLFDVASAAEARGETLAAEHTEKMSHPGFPYGTQVCEVEIDPETGAIDVVRYAAVDDVGRAVNPMILHGQAHGGIVQGAGQALLEHARYDPESGQMLAGSLMDYAIARADDFPFFDTEIMEIPSPTNPLGVRGGGEGGTTPALAVVVNAICDALAEHGVRHVEMPATPESIWRMIQDAE